MSVSTLPSSRLEQDARAFVVDAAGPMSIASILRGGRPLHASKKTSSRRSENSPSRSWLNGVSDRWNSPAFSPVSVATRRPGRRSRDREMQPVAPRAPAGPSRPGGVNGSPCRRSSRATRRLLDLRGRRRSRPVRRSRSGGGPPLGLGAQPLGSRRSGGRGRARNDRPCASSLGAGQPSRRRAELGQRSGVSARSSSCVHEIEHRVRSKRRRRGRWAGHGSGRPHSRRSPRASARR